MLEDGKIRTKPPLLSCSGLTIPELHCPITAVCKHITKKDYSIDDWRVAAKTIGLREVSAQNLVDAADSLCYLDKTRYDILKALGLDTEG